MSYLKRLPTLIGEFIYFFSQRKHLTKDYSRRIKICEICKENIGSRWLPVCNICGCFMRLKARFKEAECDRWL
jgi:hypothetical protein